MIELATMFIGIFGGLVVLAALAVIYISVEISESEFYDQ